LIALVEFDAELLEEEEDDDDGDDDVFPVALGFVALAALFDDVDDDFDAELLEEDDEFDETFPLAGDL